MSDKVHNIFSGSGCPSHEKLREYFEGKLTGEEKYLIEKHLVDCEMCSDELEGMAYMKDPEKLDKLVSEINKKINSSKRKHRILDFKYRNVAVAAVFVVLIGMSFLIYMFIDRQQGNYYASKSEFTKESEETIKESIKGEKRGAPPSGSQDDGGKDASLRGVVAEDSSPGQVLYEIPPVAEDKRASNITQKIEKIIEPEQASEEPDRTIAFEMVTEDETISSTYEPDDEVLTDAGRGIARQKEEQEIIQENIEAYDDDEASRSFSRSSKKASYTKPAKEAGSQNTELIENAMEKFGAGEFQQSKILFREILADDPENQMALYYVAYCYYETGEIDKALSYIESILPDKQNEYQKQTKMLLKQIVSDGGAYSKEAEELLKMFP